MSFSLFRRAVAKTRSAVCGPPPPPKEREVLRLAVGGDKTRMGNRVITARYNLLTFIPFSILGQFRNLTNVYFLVIFVLAVLGDQTVSGLNWYQSPFSYDGFLVSLAVVVGIGIVFDGAYDIGRHREDWKVNGHKAIRVLPDGVSTEQCNWDQLHPGDFVIVHREEMFPCDMVFLQAKRNPAVEQEDFDPERCYVETSNVDGETNLKLRLTPSPLPAGDNFYQVLRGCEMTYDLPKPKLEFSGLIYSVQDENRDEETPAAVRAPLTIRNLLLRGSILKNTHSVIGVVVYAGRETKGVMSSSETKSKVSNAMKLVNRAILSILFVGIIMVLVSAGVSSTMTTEPWYLGNPPPYVFGPFWSAVFTYIILYSNLLPISLVIATTITNFLQAVFVNWDADIPGSRCRTLELAQEIGQVSFVFSDKTGTLTRNEMKLVRCAVFGVDVEEDEVQSSDLSIPELFSGLLEKLHEQDAIKEFLLAMSLCHTVLVEGNEYNAEGPDEEALVTGVAQLGYKLVKTGRSGYEIECNEFPRGLAAGRQRFDVLSINAFDSTRKRMSTVVRFPDGQIEIYVKGADSIMLGLLAQEQDDELESTRRLYDDLGAFALEGLRTLVFAHRRMSREEWEAYELEISAANDLLDTEKDDALNAVAAKMETNLLLLGATAIEDRLQEGVSETLQCFRDAGIKTWVLTGDKAETAINIGFSSGLLTKEMKVIEVCGSDEEENDKAILALGQAIDPKQLAKIEREHHRRAGGRKKSVSSLRDTLTSFAATPTSRNNSHTVSFVGEPISGEDPYEIAKQTKLLLSNGFSEFAKQRKTLTRRLTAGTRRRGSSHKDRVAATAGTTSQDHVALENNHQHQQHEQLNVTFQDQNTTLDFNATLDNTLLLDQPSLISDAYESQQQLSQEPVRTSYLDPMQNLNNDNVEAASLALVVDGDALHGILHDVKEKNPKAFDDPTIPSTERELKFLAVAKVCKVVIACRVSPRQKALLVRLVRKGVRIGGKEPITLAVGDGANDVGMIQESRVGVGIAGREGSQAVNSADFAIHQFRYLRKLLLVHGRWNYRRISFLVLFIFYAHILPVIIAFGFNFCNMWSGTTPYPFVWVVAYSYLVVIPAIFIAAFNRDISAETALQFPSIYVSGRANLSMGRFKIFEYIFKAVIHATVLCCMLFLVFPEPFLSYYDIGTTVYWCILLTVLSRLAFECYTWTVVSAVVFFICLIVFPIVEVLMYNGSIEYSGTVLFGGWASWVWASAVVTASICILWDVLTSLLRRYMFPNLIDIVIEADRQSEGVRGFAPLVTALNVFSRPKELDRQAVLQSVRDHRANIPIMPHSRSGFAHDVVEDATAVNHQRGSASRAKGVRHNMLRTLSRSMSLVKSPTHNSSKEGEEEEEVVLAVASAPNSPINLNRSSSLKRASSPFSASVDCAQ